MTDYRISKAELRELIVASSRGIETTEQIDKVLKIFLEFKTPLPESSKDNKLDRDKVEKIINRMLKRFCKVAFGDKRWANDTADRYIDQIMQLTQITEEDIMDILLSKHRYFHSKSGDIHEVIMQKDIKDIAKAIIKRMGE